MTTAGVDTTIAFDDRNKAAAGYANTVTKTLNLVVEVAAFDLACRKKYQARIEDAVSKGPDRITWALELLPTAAGSQDISKANNQLAALEGVVNDMRGDGSCTKIKSLTPYRCKYSYECRYRKKDTTLPFRINSWDKAVSMETKAIFIGDPHLCTKGETDFADKFTKACQDHTPDKQEYVNYVGMQATVETMQYLNPGDNYVRMGAKIQGYHEKHCSDWGISEVQRDRPGICNAAKESGWGRAHCAHVLPTRLNKLKVQPDYEACMHFCQNWLNHCCNAPDDARCKNPVKLP